MANVMTARQEAFFERKGGTAPTPRSPRIPTRVFVIDPQPLTRHGLTAVLSSQSDIQVVGQTESAQEAMRIAAAVDPDVILTEIVFPQEDGIEAIRTIRQGCPHAQVLVITTRVELEVFRRAAQAGAVGYVLKDISPQQLISAIRAIRNGTTMIDPHLARKVVEELAAHDGNFASKPSESIEMTPREEEILVEVARGLTDKEIAARLHLAECTVKHYLRAIYTRYSLRNRAQAAVFIMQQAGAGRGRSLESRRLVEKRNRPVCLPMTSVGLP